MSDPILEARIDTLLKSLERPKAMSEFVRSLDSGYSHLDQDKWNQIKERLVRELVNEIDKKIDSLRRIKIELTLAHSHNAEGQAKAVSEAWRSYRDTFEQIQDLFHECLDVLGGLAFHELSLNNPTFGKEIDKDILSVAEELTWVCSSSTGIGSSLVIPAPKEALVMTLGRVVRLRCCDWTLWVLPWIAHEFGHVLMGDKGDANSKVYQETRETIVALFSPQLTRPNSFPESTQTQRLAEREIGDQQRSDAARGQWAEKERRRVQNEIEEYLADAFGTYFMGPAFPCAAIHLRLNPTSSHAGEIEDSYDHERAYVMVKVLSSMGEGGSDFRQIAFELWRDWNRMVRRADHAFSRDAESRARRADWRKKKRILKELVERILAQFEETELGLKGRYSSTGDWGWSVAVNWAHRWIGELETLFDLTLPRNITSISALRDALNAAWCTRLKCPEPVTPERIDKIANVAREVCREINRRHREAATGRLEQAMKK